MLLMLIIQGDSESNNTTNTLKWRWQKCKCHLLLWLKLRRMANSELIRIYCKTSRLWWFGSDHLTGGKIKPHWVGTYTTCSSRQQKVLNHSLKLVGRQSVGMKIHRVGICLVPHIGILTCLFRMTIICEGILDQTPKHYLHTPAWEYVWIVYVF